jgi:DNA end-binding protein Ku
MAPRARDRETPPKPRAAWKGTLAFGLVNIPVSLQRAVAPRGVLLHELHDHDCGRIRRRAVCSVDGAAVPREHIVKGVEVARGRWITLSSDELHALDPAASRAIEIVAFVDPREVDPVFYTQTYWLVPDAEAARPYALLAAAMVGLDRAAVARLTMRARQHLCLIRPASDPEGRVLALTTLGYADEILPAVGVPGPARAEVGLGDREIALAERLIGLLSGHFQPERYHDERREKILAYLEHKADGAGPAASPEGEPALQGDLFGALQASLAEVEHKTAA